MEWGKNMAALRAATVLAFLSSRVKARFASFHPGQIKFDHFVVTYSPKKNLKNADQVGSTKKYTRYDLRKP
jgi:hypothetical protein